MLTDAEKKYLKGEISDSEYRWVLKSRVKKKLMRFQNDIMPILKSNDWTQEWLLQSLVQAVGDCDLTRFSKGLTENCNLGENENSPKTPYFLKKWCGRRALHFNFSLSR